MTFEKFTVLATLTLVFGACADDGHEGHDHDGPGALTAAERASAFEEAYDQKDDRKADSLRCSGVVVPDGSGFAKRVALTFDDGPNPATTPEVMEILRRYDVPAAFFINGNRVNNDTNRALVKEMVDDPLFILANHTWSHPKMTSLSASGVASQIDDTTAVIEQAGGAAEWFRFPFGASNCTTAQTVRDRGYTVTGWHIDSADWCFAGSGYCKRSTFRHVPDSMRGDMLGWTMQQVRANNGGILLFHDIHPYTANSIEAIIVALKDEGYTFTNIDDESAFPRLNGFEPPFIGDLCEADDDCGFAADSPPFCHRAGFCTLNCEGYCPDAPGKVGTFCAGDPDTEGATGICLSQATHENGHCADLPGTIDASAERFIGSSTASARQAEVCMPAPISSD